MQSNCSRENVTYAGFWVRLAAYAVDSIITGAGLLVVKLFSAGMTALLKGTWLDGDIDCAPEFMYKHSYEYSKAG